MQAAGVDAEALDRSGSQRAAQRLGVDGQRLQPAAQPIVVEERRRDPDELLQRGPRRPAGNVVQRRGRAQPAGDQRRGDLPGTQLLAPTLGQRPVDRADQVQLAQKVRGQQHRADLAADPHERRIEPRERAHQLLQLARRLQLVLAPQRAEHPVAHTPVLIAIGLHQAQVDVAFLPPDHGVPLDVHVGPTLCDLSDGTADRTVPASKRSTASSGPHRTVVHIHRCWPYTSAPSDAHSTKHRPRTPSKQAANDAHDRQQHNAHQRSAAENAARRARPGGLAYVPVPLLPGGPPTATRGPASSSCSFAGRAGEVDGARHTRACA